ncbi:MotE family protein [Bdellovibrio sp. HCB274]|uniref:MotE family protein n=1 Tax=Bdellovibrio sp. HCB274 TaxID=3394361 RepID=UPI0039B50C71
MKTGYDQFFKNARKVADENNGSVKFTKNPASTRLHLDLSSEDVEQQLRRRMKMSAPKKKKKKSGVHWKMAGFSFLGLILAVVGFQNHEEIDNVLKRVEITLNGGAMAQSAPAPAAPVAEEKAAAEAAPEVKSVSLSNDEIDHLTKLTDRKKELDAREEELNRQEAELQAQKVELNKRLKELEDMRGKISSMLEDRVKADDQKVDTLVQMYTNMKPPQAAKVFETMDEDLVVEILGRMKKKNAADIMNLLKPEKAQIISEKYAGYKRAPASEK